MKEELPDRMVDTDTARAVAKQSTVMPVKKYPDPFLFSPSTPKPASPIDQNKPEAKE